MPSSKSSFVLKILPFAGFWEWNILENTEVISKGMAQAFEKDFPFDSEAGCFWKSILKENDFQTFIALRAKQAHRKGAHPVTTTQVGHTSSGQLILFRNKMETMEWSEEGKPVRMIGHVVELDTDNEDIAQSLRNNSLLTKLTNQVPGAIFQYQYLINGSSRFPYASKGIWNVYELTPEEVRTDATKVFDRIHPDDLDTLIQSIHDSYVTFNPWEMDYRVLLPEKGERWLRVSAKPEKLDDESVLWHGYVTDISQRKKTEEELIKVNTDLQGILNSGSQVSILSTGLDGVITHFSKGSENLLGYKAEEVVGKTTPTIFHIDHEIDLRQKQLSAIMNKRIVGFEVLVAMARQGKHDTREWTYRRKDGSTFPVQLVVTPILDNQRVPAGFLGVATDISQIQKAKKALLESEERWQFALEGAGDGVWDWDLENESIFLSPKSKKMLGFEDNELKNTSASWRSLINPNDEPHYTAQLQEHLDGKTELYVCEYRARCQSGEYKWVLDRGKVIKRDAFGYPVRIIGTHSDMSRIKEKEAELKNTIDIIGEQNRRLLNFAHIVSHNLRSHSGNFEMMLKLHEEAETEAEKAEMLSHIHTISEKLTETIAHLNEVVMVQTSIDLQRQSINLHDAVERTKKILTASISAKKATVSNNIPKNITVNYNAAYLESVLLNLMSNAVKYSHPDRLPVVTISAYEEKGNAVLKIADNGLGINLELHKGKLFGMYKTFHPNKDAKGIGLFITRNQVEAMGGKIEAESEENKGSVFTVNL